MSTAGARTAQQSAFGGAGDTDTVHGGGPPQTAVERQAPGSEPQGSLISKPMIAAIAKLRPIARELTV